LSNSKTDTAQTCHNSMKYDSLLEIDKICACSYKCIAVNPTSMHNWTCTFCLQNSVYKLTKVDKTSYETNTRSPTSLL